MQGSAEKKELSKDRVIQDPGATAGENQPWPRETGTRNVSAGFRQGDWWGANRIHYVICGTQCKPWAPC